MSYSVVFTTWTFDEERRNIADKCWRALRNTSQGQLVVVENGSPDEWRLSYPGADVHVGTKVNRGYAWAVARGLEEAKGEFVAVVSNDVEILTAGWQRLLSKPGTVCSPVDTYRNGRERRYRGSFHSPMWQAPRSLIAAVGWDEEWGNAADLDFAARAFLAGWSLERFNNVRVRHVDAHASFRRGYETGEQPGSMRAKWRRLYGVKGGFASFEKKYG